MVGLGDLVSKLFAKTVWGEGVSTPAQMSLWSEQALASEALPLHSHVAEYHHPNDKYDATYGHFLLRKSARLPKPDNKRTRERPAP